MNTFEIYQSICMYMEASFDHHLQYKKRPWSKCSGRSSGCRVFFLLFYDITISQKNPKIIRDFTYLP